MNKEKLIAAICDRRELDVEEVGEDLEIIYDEIFSMIIQAVAQGENVVVSGFGIFYPQIQHLNSKRNPSKKAVPGFIPDLQFKDALLLSTQKKEVQR